METSTTISNSLIAWGVATRALPGQRISGDMHLVQPVDKGFLLAAVDGLGHGEEAKVAAKAAVAVLENHAAEPLVTLFRRCHECLSKTRGVVMTVARLEPGAGRLTWMGVGNVEAILLRADSRSKTHADRVILRSGLV